MIGKIHIENFKSIQKLELDCKRINLIIGQPNTGKSNILEALSLLSSVIVKFDSIIRFREFSNLFYDNDIARSIIVEADKHRLDISFESSHYQYKVNGGAWKKIKETNFFLEHPFDSEIQNYKYYPINSFLAYNPKKLKAPHGENLFEILNSNPQIREMVASIFSGIGYKLQLRTQNREIEYVKEENNVLITYPWQSLSDTIQRVIFYNAVIDSNKNSTILLEEPEANTFPLHTKLLGEKVALDEANQYFIITHNPFFLLAVIDKTPVNDLAIFITETKNYSTKVREVQSEELSTILELDSDIFLNLKKFGK